MNDEKVLRLSSSSVKTRMLEGIVLIKVAGYIANVNYNVAFNTPNSTATQHPRKVFPITKNCSFDHNLYIAAIIRSNF